MNGGLLEKTPPPRKGGFLKKVIKAFSDEFAVLPQESHQMLPQESLLTKQRVTSRESANATSAKKVSLPQENQRMMTLPPHEDGGAAAAAATAASGRQSSKFRTRK